MTYTERFTETHALIDHLHPQDLTKETAGNWVCVKNYHRVVCVASIGATDQTFNLKLQEATDAAGTSSGDISGKAITQLTGADDNSIVAIELRTEELSADHDWIRFVATAGAATVTASVELYGIVSRYNPVPDNWTEVVD